MRAALLLFMAGAAQAACPPVPPFPAPPEGKYVVVGSSAKVKSAQAYSLGGQTEVVTGDCTVYSQNMTLVTLRKQTIPGGTACDCTRTRLVPRKGKYYCWVREASPETPVVAQCGVRK